MSKDNWTIDASVRNRIADDLLAAYANSVSYLVTQRLAGKTESPIEAAFGASLLGLMMARGWPCLVADTEDEAVTALEARGTRTAIVFQAPIDRYRADILVLTMSADDELNRIIVECDGHDWHERTKEQAARDKARDRFFQAEGYGVFRFTGSEIYGDPVGKADEIYKAIIKKATE
jgi:very-short-patch-repair endonuclease